MEKRKKRKIILAVVLLLLLAAAGAAYWLWGTKEKPREKQKQETQEQKPEEQKPEETAEQFLTAYREQDGEVCGKLLYNNPSGERVSFSKIQALLGENISFEIEEVKWKEEYWECDASIRNTDFAKEMETLLAGKTDISMTDIENALAERKEDEKVYKCKIIIRETDEGNKIVMTPELSNALFGGFNEYMETVRSEEKE